MCIDRPQDHDRDNIARILRIKQTAKLHKQKHSTLLRITPLLHQRLHICKIYKIYTLKH